MKAPLILIGTFIATGGGYITSRETKMPVNLKTDMPSPEFRWTLVSPDGAGSYPEEWVKGTYPAGVMPVVAFSNKIVMTGQKKTWLSSDGIHWEAHPKKDWGERISTAQVFFKDRLWMYGGMKMTKEFMNDVWSSSDGIEWKQAERNAEWQPRKGHTIVNFDNTMWLFGGATSVDKEFTPDKFLNDVWTSEDGFHWVKIPDPAPWSPRDNPNVVVFKNELWLLGGQGHSDVWRSRDGKKWIQVTEDAPWKDRYDFGAKVYNNLLWIYGGRDIDPYKSLNDVWFSADGRNWRQQSEHAPWSVRSGVHSIVFKDKLWLYSGKHKAHKRITDIWTMEPFETENARK